MDQAPAQERGTDLRLMTEFSDGSSVAADEMYRRYAPSVFGMGLRTLHDRDLAADLVQDTFVRLWRRGTNYLAGSVSLDEWVRAQALGVALQMSRHRTADRRGERRTDAERGRTDAIPIRA